MDYKQLSSAISHESNLVLTVMYGRPENSWQWISSLPTKILYRTVGAITNRHPGGLHPDTDILMFLANCYNYYPELVFRHVILSIIYEHQNEHISQLGH